MGVIQTYLNAKDFNKQKLGTANTDQTKQNKNVADSSIFKSTSSNELNYVLNSTGLSQNDPISNFIAAVAKLDAADNKKVDGSIFSAQSKRTELMNSIIAADLKDDGKINGSVFNDQIKGNQELFKNYTDATSDQNKGNNEVSNKFIDSLMQNDAQTNKSFDTSFLNNNVAAADKSTIQNNLNQSLTKADFFRMMLKMDLADDGVANGSIYKNETMQKYFDILDDGKINNSAQNFINYLANQAIEQGNAQKYSPDSNFYNEPDTTNPGTMLNNNLSAAYGMLPGGIDNSILSQVSSLNNITQSLLQNIKSTPYSPGQFYGNNQMTTNPNVPVNTATQQQMQGATATGQQLAKAAEGVAKARGTTGRCYAGVCDSLRKIGVNVSGMSAYMAADQLANSPKFKEVKVSPDQLKSLPSGAIVVWGKTDVSPHGHISVALGDGREASDHIQSQMSALRGHQNCRVFMPV